MTKAGILSSKKVLVSGGTGFVGSATVRALAEKYSDCAITVLDRSPPRPEHALPDKIAYLQVDITSADEVSKALQAVQPDVVVHTAGIVPALADRFGRGREREVWKINVEGTRNVLNAAKKAGVTGFVYTSTTNCDQAAAEALVLLASSSTMVTCSLRPSVLCGPGDYQLIPSIHACIAKYETPFVIGDGLNLWDVTYVTNIADAHVLAVENLMTTRTAAGEAFFIQNNEPITFRDFCLAIWTHFGHIPPFEVRIPEGLAFLAGLACESATWVTGGTTTLSRGSVRDACAVRYASGDKAKEILGYEARIGIEEGIRLSCEVSRIQDLDCLQTYLSYPGICPSSGDRASY
ncbi:hypothetical protein N7510_011594 [Penicillium lagena]|uniref:uncharacterized protein n=1 Tax=Penicillium lagena TaxID=94218 RepID=UPI0025420756|nr:uncharacterized protein N7510_011594 [Penicillium lagena]KAJ5602060.1 hypothetical protein N7510_011594 [Penicillium lagena]